MIKTLGLSFFLFFFNFYFLKTQVQMLGTLCYILVCAFSLDHGLDILRYHFSLHFCDVAIP